MFDYTFQIVLAGTAILGVVAGTLGTFAVLRKQSLLGDAISHATLPGIGIAFLLTLTKSPLLLVLGAAISGWIATVLMKLTLVHTTLKKDAALGIILSVFFGFGLVILTLIQRHPTANKTGLNTYLFGNAATLLAEDVILMAVIGTVVLILLALFWKEFKIISFDPALAQSQGLPVGLVDIMLTTLLVVSIVIGLQCVGVVLMSAMIIAPAAAARQWTDKLGVMVVSSAFIGGATGVLGATWSSLVPKIPTGPAIVIVVSVVVVISLLFAPNRGLLFSWFRHHQNRSKIHADTILTNMLLFTESETDPFHPHDLAAFKAVGRIPLDRTLLKLERQGFIRTPRPQFWALTPKGLERAQKLVKSKGG